MITWKKAGQLLLLISMLCALGAIGFICYNIDQNQKAAAHANQILNNWDDMPLETTNDMDLVRSADLETGYMAVIELPTLGITLPVNEEWSEDASHISPCRYQGNLKTKDLIIAGHNYGSHFGYLHDLQLGDPIIITDASQKKYEYQVSKKETIPGTSIDKMQKGEWDLTLFTCDYMGTSRITIRCQLVKNQTKI